MNNAFAPTRFQAAPMDSAGLLSWMHIGDLHTVRAGEQNDLDLRAILATVNRCFADSICFVYLPGDIADDGSRSAYRVVRQALDTLSVPWCGILGDHDVHEKSFANYKEHIHAELHYAFTVGGVRFLALNAFDEPHPASFAILPEQLRWLEEELQHSERRGESVVLLLHCYPTDLKTGSKDLIGLIGRYDVRLIDMGHTHYNEIANDGKTIYTATRSTGQIEEGKVGFSVTNFDGGDISWRFFELGELPVVMITSPADERLATRAAAVGRGRMRVRAKVWGQGRIDRVEARIESHAGDRRCELSPVPGSRVWEGVLPTEGMSEGVYSLYIEAHEAGGDMADDAIRVVLGKPERPEIYRYPRDQDNTIGAWPEHGVLGTQLGPNKNGRKW